MAVQKWFDRKFEFNTSATQFQLLLERLKAAPEQLRLITARLEERRLNNQPDGKWSVKEQAGHLFIMEPLWRKRLEEIKDNSETMSPADLNNTATHRAGFNNYPITEILDNFSTERKETILLLRALQPEAFHNSLFHPRLQQAMSITDLLYFVAEHDRHHMNIIGEMIIDPIL